MYPFYVLQSEDVKYCNLLMSILMDDNKINSGSYICRLSRLHKNVDTPKINIEQNFESI